MQPRIDFYTASPDGLKAMMALEAAVSKLPLEKSLIELVKLRASQINGCAFCIDMHTADAIKGGETPRRLFAVTAWREAPFFTDRERAALALDRILDPTEPDPRPGRRLCTAQRRVQPQGNGRPDRGDFHH
ncbi:AhpD family alkylhydroperoxidase [Pseudomonas sp. YL-218 TE3947]